MPKNIDQAIIQTLLSNGLTTSNELHRLTQEIVSCTQKTFSKHALILAEEGKIQRKVVGQYVEFSVSNNEEEYVTNASTYLDKIFLESEEYFPKVIKKLKSFEKRNREKNLTFKNMMLTNDIGTYYSNIILNNSKILSLMIYGGFSDSDTKQKARELQAKYNQQLQELFQSIRKIGSQFAIQIFMMVLSEQKIKHGRGIMGTG